MDRQSERINDIEDTTLTCPSGKPCVGMYGPSNISNLTVGQKVRWCTCGLSKNQPFCDNSHIGTTFKPLIWTVPGTEKDGKTQLAYSLCACKYTGRPPYCDGSHIHLPLKYHKQMRECTQNHESVEKLCSSCGYTPGTVIIQ